MKILRLPLPKTNEIHTYFIAGDWHDFYLHRPTYRILLQLAKKVDRKRRFLIINGDFLDLEFFMPKNERFKKHINDSKGLENLFLPETKKAITWGNKILDELQDVFGNQIIFGEGNHDVRMHNFMVEHAPHPYKDEFNIRKQLRLNERDIRFYAYNSWLDIGKLSITHGMYHGPSAIKKHMDASGRNVIFSHVHSWGLQSFIRRGDTVISASLPAMCKLNPPYMKNMDNNWSNGFGIVNMRHTGDFNFNVMTVWKDMLVLPTGEIIK